MATVGAKLTIPFTVGAGQIVGQGSKPELWVLYTTDDASVAAPVWLDATAKARAWSSARGRSTEQDDVAAGTATVELDNRTRVWDPVNNVNIRPMNRWWLREQFTGETQDLFKGYADSYDQAWPSPVGDAVATVHCTDEGKVLAAMRVPVTTPPRGSYAEVVAFDQPSAYYPLDEDPALIVQEPEERPDAAPVGAVGDKYRWIPAKVRIPKGIFR